MALLTRFDPPAFLPDFNTIPGQLEAWDAAMRAWFDAVVTIERDRIGGATPQYYNPAAFDPGGAAVEQAILWNAFPKEIVRRYGRERALALTDWPWPIERYFAPTPDPLDPSGTSGILYRPQTEYCEWHVERVRATGKIRRITFTSEPPEIWQALFGSVPGGGGFPNVSFPGDRKRLLEAYREWVSRDVQMEDLIAQTDVTDATGNVWIAKGEYNFYNKWNTSHGVVHLNSPPNSLVAEIQLGGDATVLHDDPQGRLLVEPDALIAYAGYGGPNRNSDPTIGASVNALARLGAWVTLLNPVGLYMDHIDLSGWSAPGGVAPTDFVRIVRGTPGMIERLVVEAPAGSGLTVSDLTIAGTPVRFGGQIAECITVKLTGLANIVAGATPRAPIAATERSYIDPHWPTVISRAQADNIVLPPGTVEAYLDQGAVPAPPRKTALRARRPATVTAAAKHAAHRHRHR